MLREAVQCFWDSGDDAGCSEHSACFLSQQFRPNKILFAQNSLWLSKHLRGATIFFLIHHIVNYNLNVSLSIWEIESKWRVSPFGHLSNCWRFESSREASAANFFFLIEHPVYSHASSTVRLYFERAMPWVKCELAATQVTAESVGHVVSFAGIWSKTKLLD